MIPIVFCASFVPWLNAMNAADRIWARPKIRRTDRPPDLREQPIDQEHDQQAHRGTRRPAT